MSGQTLTEIVMEQWACSRDEATKYMDALEELGVIERQIPQASWDAGAWVLNEDGTRSKFAGPLSD